MQQIRIVDEATRIPGTENMRLMLSDPPDQMWIARMRQLIAATEGASLLNPHIEGTTLVFACADRADLYECRLLACKIRRSGLIGTLPGPSRSDGFSPWIATPILPARERLPVDLDEDERGGPFCVIHPDCGRDGSRPGVHALPHTACRVAITPAGRRLTLAFREALIREDVHHVLRRRDPTALALDPCDPALFAERPEARQLSHGAPG